MTDVPNDLGPVSSICAGFGANTCAVKTDGTAQCWALNSPASVPADLGIVSSINAGYDYFCAVKTDGSIQCWGSDVSGESTVPPYASVTKSESTAASPYQLMFSSQIEEE